MTISHIKPGVYEHYKSTAEKPMFYLVEKENIVMHSEPTPKGSLQELVIYRCLYDNPVSQLWARPREMFEETVEFSGETTPRFRYVAATVDELPDELRSRLRG